MVAVTIAYCTQNNVHLNNSATKLGHFPAREHLHLSSYTHYENDIEKCNRGSRAYKSTSHINREYYRRYSAMYKTPAGNSSATAATAHLFGCSLLWPPLTLPTCINIGLSAGWFHWSRWP